MRIAAALFLLSCAAVETVSPDATAAGMTTVATFGANPGALGMYEYVPAGLPAGAPLVVVLHGCTQNAMAMVNAGWNKLADQYHFAVIYPEQKSGNNPVSCFNWAGEYGDTANLVRGQGENQSIISMVDSAIASHGVARDKVYIVGFSAGAAMAAVMLATWPDRFAAGSIMEGVAYRCATSVNGAFSCQSPGVTKTPAQWGDLVRAASTMTMFPRVQIWAGTGDTTVVPANATELVKQWTDVHGIDQTADDVAMLGGTKREQYKAGATTAVELLTVPMMKHAIAFDSADMGCPTTAAQYYEDRGICATVHAAAFFGIGPTISTGTGNPGGTDAAPTVAFLQPSGGSEVTGQVTVVVAASDETSVASVDLAIDGAMIGSDADAPYQFAWDASAATPGEHELVATAHDGTGHVATATVRVTIPGAGGGGGGNGAGGDDDGGPGDLPGCSLDAGGGGSLAPLAGFLALGLVRRRRSK